MTEANDLLTEISDDFKRLQQQKCRETGGFEARVLTNLAMLADEQYVNYHNRRLMIKPMDANKLHLVFNLSSRLLNKIIGRLCSINGIYYARPDHNDPKAKSHAEVVNKLILALDEKVGQPTRTWELVYWMAVAGVAFEMVTWQKDAVKEPMPVFDETTGELIWRDELTQEELPESVRQQMVAQGVPPERFCVKEDLQLTGDVGSEILSPLQVFMDSSARSVQELSPDQAIYVAKIRTIGWIQENFTDLDPEKLEKLRGTRDLKIVTTTFSQPTGMHTGFTHLEDLIPRIQGSRSSTDPEMVVVVERYQGMSKTNPHGKYTVFVPGECVLLDGDNPYEEIPIVDFHWSPPTTTFWSRDGYSTLIAPQRFLNKRLSQLGEQANATIYSNPLLGPGLTKESIVPDAPAPIEGGVSPDGIKMVQRQDPPQLPSWFMKSIDLSIQLMREIAGGSDLFSESKFPGQLRGPLAVPMLQEIMDTEWGPLYEHIGERMSLVKQMRLNRVKKFYPPYRTLHYTNADMRDEVFVFHKDEILGAGIEYRVTVERGSLLPELRALREERVLQRLQSGLAILYTDERTGKLDKHKIAADIHFNDAARESSEQQARKLAGELIDRIVKSGGQPLPPHLPYPFWNHRAMMDELEARMTTTEFLESSPAVTTALLNFWERCRQQLSRLQEAQQQSIENQMIQGAVAQAAQQTAAKVAATTTEVALSQARMGLEQGEEAPEMLARSMAEREAQEQKAPPQRPRR